MSVYSLTNVHVIISNAPGYEFFAWLNICFSPLKGLCAWILKIVNESIEVC